ncbi:TRAPP II complex [Hygrophoropsis aurantiaca]|uniref:TRAPP II complex n=1 Tax=Hygrophoropsis aurantiaca TaxID=72124 RepID=A0ACB8AMK7_9AGAM|nr:TRAPP II complex [Hygrophoropsis aurantiaca]
MSSHAFASLAHIRILLVPVGSIPRNTFEKFAAEIRAFDSIRLGDIPADTKDERARFMPSPLSSGYIHISFPSHPTIPSHLPLSLFRPSHFTLGIIGIALCSQHTPAASILEQFENSLSDLSSEDSTFPLAKICFAFEDNGSEGNIGLKATDNVSGLVIIPSVMGNKKLYIGTLLADLCSQILGEFGRVVNVLETPLGNEYLNSTLFPTLPTSSQMPPPLDSDSKFDLPPHLMSHSSQSEIGFSTLNAPSNFILKRNSSATPGVNPSTSMNPNRQSTLSIPPVKKRPSAVGAASPHGRLYKVLADFFLLAGRTEDATLWYTEAIVLFKATQDPIWHASALEGMATASVLLAWSAGHGLQASVSNTNEPWNDVYDKLSQAISLYMRATIPPDREQNYSLLAYIYTTAVLRQTSLLFCVWAAKGWGALAFASMLQPGATSYMQKIMSDNSWSNLERLNTVTGISRSQIAGVLSQAHGPWLLHLGPNERLNVLQSIASIFACIGYKRKEVYILRELLSCIMDLIVCGREENDQLRKSDVGSAIRNMDPLDGDSTAKLVSGSVGIRQNESPEGNQSILRVLIYACKVLGVDLQSVKLAQSDIDPHTDGQDSSANTSVDQMSSDSFGWPELQVGVIREAIAVAEALPDHLVVGRIALSALKSMHSVLSIGDQFHLYQTASRALAITRRRGDAGLVEYWADCPILSIAVTPLPINRFPIQKPASLLALRSSSINPILTGVTDPFLYNPRKSLGGQGKSLIVQSEPFEFVITLQNPFVFELELQSVSLSTTGVPFECQSVSSIVIPPNSVYPVAIVGLAPNTGTLSVRGCIIQAPGGVAKEFTLPMSTEAEDERVSRRQSAIKCESGRTKYSGLDSRPWKWQKRTSTLLPLVKNGDRFLECTVIPQQPLLRIRWTSLTHEAVMLYDGEKSTIRLTLENISSLPVDFLRLSFEDSTINPAQTALSEGELSVFETYETEYNLIHRRAFSWSSEKEISTIKPGQKAAVTVTCLGKVGCTSGAIHASYAYVNRGSDEPDNPQDTFYTRQLTYPVTVTVYHMLECHDMSILPMDGVEGLIDDDQSSSTVQTLDETGQWCLFSVDIRNTYGLPFEITFERTQEGTPRASVSSIVPPGSMSRVIIPIKKFKLADELVTRPIPTLSDRQFVVSRSNLSSDIEKAQRELFWYREELFKYIQGHWKEANGTRWGILSLRQQRMTLPMLKILRTDEVAIHLSLIQDEDNEAASRVNNVQGVAGKYQVAPNDVYYLQAKISNATSSPLVLALDLVIDPQEHVIVEGISSDIPMARLEEGESQTIKIAVCFLCSGRFEFGLEARVLGRSDPSSRAGIGRLRAMVREQSE